jgi:hypothetical protein
MRDGGKGDSQRPLGIPMEQFDNAWDRIFNKAKIAEAINETIAQHETLLGDLAAHEKECGK